MRLIFMQVTKHCQCIAVKYFVFIITSLIINSESLDKNISELEDFGHVMSCFNFY